MKKVSLGLPSVFLSSGIFACINGCTYDVYLQAHYRTRGGSVSRVLCFPHDNALRPTKKSSASSRTRFLVSPPDAAAKAAIVYLDSAVGAQALLSMTLILSEAIRPSGLCLFAIWISDSDRASSTPLCMSPEYTDIPELTSPAHIIPVEPPVGVFLTRVQRRHAR